MTRFKHPLPCPAPVLPLPGEPERRWLIADVLRAAARSAGCPVRDLTSQRRDQPLVAWRQAALEVAVQATGASLPAIGRVFARDHTTVIHARRRIAHAVRLGDREVSARLAAICAELTTRTRPVPQPKPEPAAAVVPATTLPVLVARPAPSPKREPPPPPLPPRPQRTHPLSCDAAAAERWFAENDARFRHAFRAAHPEMEIRR